jgi:hypothetical protein
MSQLINLRLLDETPWEATSLGPMRDWPRDVEQVVQTLLHSAFPTWTAWGEDEVQIYNDGYNAILGDKHPASFGAPAAQSWPEIWEFVKPGAHEASAHPASDALLRAVAPQVVGQQRGPGRECRPVAAS